MERKLKGLVSKEEIALIRGAYDGKGGTMFEQMVEKGNKAAKVINKAYGIPEPELGKGKPAEATPVENAPEVPAPAAAPIEDQPVKAAVVAPAAVPAKEPAVDATPTAQKPAAPVEAPKANGAEKFSFTKEYISEAKEAVAKLRVELGETKFAEIEAKLSKGLSSPIFGKNMKHMGYNAEQNVYDIALKAQGFIGIPTAEEKAAKVESLRESAQVAPTPVVDMTPAAKGKTHKDLMRDLKSGNATAKRNAIYQLTGADETWKEIKSKIGR